MPIALNSSISSLQAERRLSQHTAELGKVFQRLSSGLRINRAADDAAGLAVASGLNTDRRIYSQGIRNINDGVSVVSIAEGALEQLETIVIRIQELAEQAANGTLTITQRKALDAEAQALSKEYLRIAQTTEFNGKKLFDQSSGDLSIQCGYGLLGSIGAGLGGKVGDGTFGAPRSHTTLESMTTNAIGLADLNNDGVVDMVTAGANGPDGSGGGFTVRLGIGDGTFGGGRAYDTAESAAPNALSLGDLNGDGILDMVTAGYNGPDGSGGGVSIRLGIGDGTFGGVSSYDMSESLQSHALSLSDLNNDGVLDMVTAGRHGPDGSGGGVSIRLGIGDGTFGAVRSYDMLETSTCYAVAIGDLNKDGINDLVTTGPSAGGRTTVRLGNGDGTFRAAKSYAMSETVSSRALSLGDLNSDGILDMVTAGDNGPDGSGGGMTVRLGNGDGTFRAARGYDMSESVNSLAMSVGDLNGDGKLDLITVGRHGPDGSGGGATVRLGIGDGTFRAATSYDTHETQMSRAVALADLNNDGVLDFASGGYEGPSDKGGVTIMLGNTTSGVAPLLDFSLRTKADAKFALMLMKQKLSQLTVQRGTLGALQSRFQTAANVYGSTIENISSAESQIRDADIADESAQLVRLQMLQQATAAILGQANAQPQLALSLLRG